MHALVLTKENAPPEYLDRPDPKPAAGEVLVKLKAAALNRRDFWITQGLYPGIEVPCILGSDGAGVVEEVAEGVADDLIGTEVIINPALNWGDNPAAQGDDFQILGMPRDGTFAEAVVVPAIQVAPKPKALSWEEAAALPLAGLTAYRALFSQGKFAPGQNVLVTGIGGGVSSMALQFASAAGAKVYVSSSSEEKIAGATELGAAGGVLYTADDWVTQLRELAGTIDLVIDGAGGPGYNKLLDLVSPGGRIISYGGTAGLPEKLDLRKHFWKQLHLTGSTMGSPDDFANMLLHISAHDIKPLVDRTVPLAEGAEAIASMASSPQFGKVVLKVA